MTIPQSNYASSKQIANLDYKNRGRSPNERIHVPSMHKSEPIIVDLTQYKSDYP